MSILSELFKVSHNYGQLPNTDRKFLSTDQSKNMTSKTNREVTNENALPKKFTPDANLNNFKRDQAQAIDHMNTNFDPTYKFNHFDSTDSRNGEEIHL